MTAQVNMDLFEIEIKNKLQKMSVGMFNNSSYWGKSSSVLHLFSFKTPNIYIIIFFNCVYFNNF